MTTLDELKTDLEDVKTVVMNVSGDVDNLITQINDLKAQIAGGAGVTQADIDALAASAVDIKDSLAAVDTKANTPSSKGHKL